MSVPDLGSRTTVVLVDTNVIIEAVRVGCWKALTGARQVETVEECRDETQRGSPHDPGYVMIGATELGGLAAAHPVTDAERAAFYLGYEEGPAMDPGERDLMAHAYARMQREDSVWVACSPDKASIRAAVAIGCGDNMVSLEKLIEAIGTRPRKPLLSWHSARWLSDFRTAVLLGR